MTQENKRKIGTFLFLGGLMVMFFTVGRALYFPPMERSGSPATATASDTASTGLIVPGGVVDDVDRSGQNTTGSNTRGGATGGSSTSSPTSRGNASTTSAGVSPSRLEIPKLRINAKVQHLGVTNSGLMAAPSNYTDVSWYRYGTKPGDTGSAVIAGHEDNALSLDGVFKRLNNLQIGDSVYVVGSDGRRLQFKVIEKRIYAYDDPKPLQRIFTQSNGKYLNLITCAGEWLPSARTNDKRLVVYTELVT
jgi:sortase A